MPRRKRQRVVKQVKKEEEEDDDEKEEENSEKEVNDDDEKPTDEAAKPSSKRRQTKNVSPPRSSRQQPTRRSTRTRVISSYAEEDDDDDDENSDTEDSDMEEEEGNQQEQKEEEDEEEEKPVHPAKRQKKARNKSNNDEAEAERERDEKEEVKSRDKLDDKHEEDDDKEDDKDSDNETAKWKRPNSKTRKRRRRRRTANDGDNDDDDELKCPHCDRTFTVLQGLNYHVKQFVCRPDLRPGGPVPKGRRKKQESSGKSFKRVRGSLQDRTCPNCQRVFTSVLGRDYHVEKKVCQTVTAKTKSTKTKQNIRPYPLLEPGELFATAYGVVRVVSDQRATPTADFPDRIKELCKNWGSAKQKREVSQQKHKTFFAGTHLAKRMQLSKLYQQGNITQQAVFYIALGKNHPKEHSKTASRPINVPPPLGPDPAAPADSFPDRMVECELVSDERLRFFGPSDHSPSPYQPILVENEGKSPTRLFLRRRLLTDSYNPKVSVYQCDLCGHPFLSKPGCKYHTQSQVCLAKAKAAKEAQTKYLEEIAKKGKRIVHHEIAVAATTFGVRRYIIPPPVGTTGISQKRVFKRKREKKLAHVSVYPEVWLSLGFKLLPRSIAKTMEGRISAFAAIKTEEKSSGDVEINNELKSNSLDAIQGSESASAVVEEPIAPTYVDDSVKNLSNHDKGRLTKKREEDMEHPDEVLKDIMKQLRQEQSRLLGPMYPAVFYALGFKHAVSLEEIKPAEEAPTKKASITRSLILPHQQHSDPQEEPPKKKRRRRKRNANGELEPLPPPEPTNLKPITQLLPPTLDTRVLVAEVDAGRYPSINRNKDNVVHEEVCHICKQEEEDEGLLNCDFCTKAVHFSCLRIRFIVKYPEPEDEFMCNQCIQYILARRARAEKRRLNKVGDQGLKAQDEFNLRLVNEVVPGKEYESLEAQGRRLNELVELLRDSQSRLTHCLEVSRMSQLRMEMLGSVEKG